MTEPTTDEKIELLVRSVLEAVDARLDAVRHELAGFAADVEQRHHHLLESIAALDARVSSLGDPTHSEPTGSPDIAGLRDDLADLRAQIAALAEAPSPRSDAATTDVEELPNVAPEPEPGAPATITGSHPITQAELDEISRPIVTHITTQVPIVPDPTAHHENADPTRRSPLPVPPPVAPTFTPAEGTPAVDGDDSINLDQLASLLTERLGHLSLPSRPE